MNDQQQSSPLGASLDLAMSRHPGVFAGVALRETGRNIRAQLERERGLVLNTSEDVTLGEAFAEAYAEQLDAIRSWALPRVTLDEVLRHYWRIVRTPSDSVLQHRRKRQAEYQARRRATPLKPEDGLSADQVYALLTLDSSPLTRRERQALLDARLSATDPVTAADKKARTRMRAALSKISTEVLDVLVSEHTERLNRIENDTRATRAMVEALYNAHLVAPLNAEADEILSSEEEMREVADMTFALDDELDGFTIS